MVLLAVCSANAVAFLQRHANQADDATGAEGHADERPPSNDAPTSRSLMFATVPQKMTYSSNVGGGPPSRCPPLEQQLVQCRDMEREREKEREEDLDPLELMRLEMEREMEKELMELHGHGLGRNNDCSPTELSSALEDADLKLIAKLLERERAARDTDRRLSDEAPADATAAELGAKNGEIEAKLAAL